MQGLEAALQRMSDNTLQASDAIGQAGKLDAQQAIDQAVRIKLQARGTLADVEAIEGTECPLKPGGVLVDPVSGDAREWCGLARTGCLYCRKRTNSPA